MKIGILGGSFDPPHIGHLSISRQVKAMLGLDEVWLMPCYQHRFQKNLSPAGHRLAMVKFLEEEGIKVSEFELAENKQSFTVDTLLGLIRKFPEHVFYWIMGSDQIEEFTKYKNWQEIISKYNLIIFPREPDVLFVEEKVKKEFNLVNIPDNIIVLKCESIVLKNISSTGIRQRIKNNEPIVGMVPREVEEYINKYMLYK